MGAIVQVGANVCPEHNHAAAESHVVDVLSEASEYGQHGIGYRIWEELVLQYEARNAGEGEDGTQQG